jgi:alpha-ketoglutarate-dependent taurine dioxygenase
MQQNDTYIQWRESKLAVPSPQADLLRVHIADPTRVSTAERAALEASCRRHNFALFRLETPPEDPASALAALGRQLGLARLDHNPEAGDDGITALEDRSTPGSTPRYIPYTDKPLSWHTDGYYNPPARQVRAWLLYCAQDAAEGGENALLDHEIAYLRLRDHDPRLAAVLFEADVFTIPANEQDGQEMRAAQSGPVFSWMRDNGRLHMRYSARQRNVQWREDAAVQEATRFLSQLFSAGDDRIFRYRLDPGEGIVSNNALHARTGFRDDPGTGRRRLVYRARYYDRVANT